MSRYLDKCDGRHFDLEPWPGVSVHAAAWMHAKQTAAVAADNYAVRSSDRDRRTRKRRMKPGLLGGVALMWLLTQSMAASADARVVAQLQGSWNVVGATMNGKQSFDPGLLASTWIFRGHELTVDSPDKGIARFVLTMEPNADPKAFHLASIPPAHPQSGWMLFSFDGNHLRIAFHDNLDGGRPAGFQSATGSRAKLIVVTLASTRDVTGSSAAATLKQRDLCAILRASGVGELLGTPPPDRKASSSAPSCNATTTEDSTRGVSLEALVVSPVVSRQVLGGAVSLRVVVPSHPAVGKGGFEQERERARRNTHATFQDEPAFGAAAFSLVSPQGDAVTIVALKGETFVQLGLRVPGANSAELRGFAQRLLANF